MKRECTMFGWAILAAVFLVYPSCGGSGGAQDTQAQDSVAGELVAELIGSEDSGLFPDAGEDVGIQEVEADALDAAPELEADVFEETVTPDVAEEVDTLVEAVWLDGSDTCAGAPALPPVPAHIEGTTLGFEDDYDFYADECPGAPFGGGVGGDAVYSFTPAVSATYAVTVYPDYFYSTRLYIVGDCSDIPNTCVGAGNVEGIQQVIVVLEAGKAYYIIVDGFSGDEGDFELTVSQPCFSDCSGKQCGDDGC